MSVNETGIDHNVYLCAFLYIHRNYNIDVISARKKVYCVKP